MALYEIGRVNLLKQLAKLPEGSERIAISLEEKKIGKEWLSVLRMPLPKNEMNHSKELVENWRTQPRDLNKKTSSNYLFKVSQRGESH